MTTERTLALIEKRIDEIQANQMRLEKKLSELHQMLNASTLNLIKRINEKNNLRATPTEPESDSWRIISFTKQDERPEDKNF